MQIFTDRFLEIKKDFDHFGLGYPVNRDNKIIILDLAAKIVRDVGDQETYLKIMNILDDIEDPAIEGSSD